MRSKRLSKYDPAVQRTAILFLFFLGVIVFLISGLFYRQIIQHTLFLQKEAYQNQRRMIIPAPRGHILDRNGKIVVQNKPIFNLQLFLDDIRQEVRQEYLSLIRQKKLKRTEATKLSRKNVLQKYLNLVQRITGRTCPIRERSIERHYRESLLLPLTVLSNLTPEEYSRLVDLLPTQSPLYISTDYYRYYPYHTAACHVLGYVSTNHEIHREPNDLRSFLASRKVGKTGIELSQNEALSGTDGEAIFSVDPSGFRAQLIQQTPPQKGADCYLSIDIDLQLAAEQAIGSRFGSAVVLDIPTGEVLAMANYPNYDANLLSPKISTEIYQQITDEEAWLNRALQGCYPPASTFKIISSIAFLRNKVASWDPSDITECIGKTKIGIRTFNCDHSTAHGSVSLATAIKKSCNVYYYTRSQQCGIKTLAEEARRFHLDQRTGIELPFETHRMTIPTAEWKEQHGYGKWFPGDTANTSIGQGYLLFSPLQMACFIASVAANRTLTIPHILHDPQHQQSTLPTIGLPTKTYQKLIQTLQEVIDSGTGRLAKVKNISVAGKSGTAQVWEKGKRRNVAWFIGFAPVERPQVAIAVALQEKTAEDNFYGGKTAAPVAGKILDFYFNQKR